MLALIVQLAAGVEWWQNSRGKLIKGQTYLQQINGKSFKVVKFFTPFCRLCKDMKPFWGQVISNFQNRKIQFLEVNCDTDKSLCMEQQVYQYPFFIFFSSAGQEVFRQGGFLEKQSIIQLIEQYLKTDETDSDLQTIPQEKTTENQELKRLQLKIKQLQEQVQRLRVQSGVSWLQVSVWAGLSAAATWYFMSRKRSQYKSLPV